MKIISIVLLLQMVLVAPGFGENFPGGAAPSAETEFFDPFDSPSQAVADIADPLEPLNRVAFWVNDKVYTYLLKPVCLSLPAEVRDGIGDWVKALGEPVRLGSAHLDFKFRDAGSEVGRFVLQGVLRILALGGPAGTDSLTGGGEDFSRVLEAFGVGPGIYLVLPVLGPSSLREGLGRITSVYLDPAPILLNFRGECRIDDDWSLMADLQTYESIRKSTLDPYLSIRDAYAQQQASERRRDYVSMESYGGRSVSEPASRSYPRHVLKASFL